MKQLKFNPDKDMKELEKYGFKHSSGYYYRFYEEDKFGHKIGTRINILDGTAHSGEVLKTWIDKLGFQSTKPEEPEKVDDLIKANLLIVESDEDANITN